MAKRTFKFWKFENIAGIFQSLRFNSCAGEQEGVGHFAEDEAGGEGWHGEDGRAREDLAERPCEFTVGHGARRDRVDWSTQGFLLQRILDNSDDIIERDPTHVLMPTADAPTKAKSKRRQHLGERAALRAQDNAESEFNDADASLARRLSFRFPFATDAR